MNIYGLCSLVARESKGNELNYCRRQKIVPQNRPISVARQLRGLAAFFSGALLELMAVLRAKFCRNRPNRFASRSGSKNCGLTYIRVV